MNAYAYLAIVLSVFVVLFAIRKWYGPLSHRGLDTTPDTPRNFGYKITWLAVPASGPEAVIECLSASDPAFAKATVSQANWESGFDRIFASGWSSDVFVTPSVDGWVFVVGYGESFGTSDDRTAKLHLESLSHAFGEAYLFGSHRVVSATLWAIARDGELIRAFTAVDFETLENFGDPPEEEVAMQLLLPAELGDDATDEDFDRVADESTVLELASKWTLDPRTLETHETSGVGRLVRAR